MALVSETVAFVPVFEPATLVSSMARSKASTFAMTSATTEPAGFPAAASTSARARRLGSTCRPSTFDDARDPVRSSSRAHGASAGWARSFRLGTAASAWAMIPASSAGKTSLKEATPGTAETARAV